MEVVRTLPGLLAERSAADPDHVALLLDGERPLTLGRWHSESDAVARGLVARGVRPGDRVALRFTGDEWLDYAVAFVAVTAVGATAVPLPAGLPPARVEEILSHCGAGLVLDSGGLAPGVGELPIVAPGDLAQIIYTSGTTGAPKGVYASHANLTHGLGRLAHSRHVVHAFPMGTNAAQTLMTTALVAVPTVVVAASFEPKGFTALVQRCQAESIFVVPAMAVALLEHASQLKCVELIASSAASLPPAVALRLTEALPNVTVINSYTSTEAAPAFTSMIFDPSRPTAVGRSRDVKVDAARRVWLRSPFPRGYFGSSTSATFVDGWVRTGDLGYLDADGYLHLLDREGDEVKVAGHRVSTLRVENALYEHPSVVEAAVAGSPHPRMGTQLTANVVLRAPAPDLRSFLAARLAPHEIPTQIDVSGALPRNEMGKVVKPHLAALAATWRQVLGVGAVGPDDNFFALGGDSLTAARLADRLGCSLETVFGHPTLAGLAAATTHLPPPPSPSPVPATPHEDPRNFRVSAASSLSEATISRNLRGSWAPESGSWSVETRLSEAPLLTATQESLLAWMYETDPPRDAGPVSVGIRIRDQFDPGLFERALNTVIGRHDALRMLFSGRVPRILPACPPSVRTVATPQEALADREGHFDLERGPLVRAAVVRLADEDHILSVAVHHLVFDGASMGLLLHETGLAYSALRVGAPMPLRPLPLSYAEHAGWTRDQWTKNVPYWTKRLADAPAFLDFPQRREATRIAHADLRFTFGSSRVIGRIAQAHDATTFMVLAACWIAVLSRITGSQDIICLVPMQGRLRPGSEQIIGCLVQSVLLRVTVPRDPAFAGLLALVRKAALEAADHQFHPFAEFYRRHSGASFLRVEHWAGPAHFPGLESEPYELPRALDAQWSTPDGVPDRQAPELAVVEQADGTLQAWLLWNRHAFDRSTMDRMARDLAELVHNLPGQTGLRLAELMPAEEDKS